MGSVSNIGEGIGNLWRTYTQYLTGAIGGAAAGAKEYVKQEGDAKIAEANTAVAEEKRKNDSLLAEKKEQDKRYQDELDRAARIADQDARRRSAAGRSSTILTSPLGVTESYTGTRKTLLGQ